MALIIPPGYAQCSVEFSQQGGSAGPKFTTFGAHLVGGGDISAAAEAVEGFFNDRLYVNDVALVKLNIDTATTHTEVPLTNTAKGGNATSPQVACLVKKVTNIRGVENRGRMYLPGVLSDDDVGVGGLIDPDVLENLQTGMSAFLSELETNAGVEMVVLHSGSSDPTPVGSLLVEALVATQRRRLR